MQTFYKKKSFKWQCYWNRSRECRFVAGYMLKHLSKCCHFFLLLIQNCRCRIHSTFHFTLNLMFQFNRSMSSSFHSLFVLMFSDILWHFSSKIRSYAKQLFSLLLTWKVFGVVVNVWDDEVQLCEKWNLFDDFFYILFFSSGR